MPFAYNSFVTGSDLPPLSTIEVGKSDVSSLISSMEEELILDVL